MLLDYEGYRRVKVRYHGHTALAVDLRILHVIFVHGFICHMQTSGSLVF